MSQLIVGLFATRDQAYHAIQELSGIGVDSSEIATAAVVEERDSEVAPGSAVDTAEVVAAALREAGLSEAHAHSYAETVRAGGAVIVVTPQGVPAANVKAVMLSCGSLDIDGDPQPNTLGQAPHLEPGAASPGIGLRDPGAVGIGQDDGAPVAERPFSRVAPAEDGYGVQGHGRQDGLWEESSKAGTGTGAVAGAATGAAAGSAGGPVGAVIGAVAGAVVGGGVGAAGDAAGEQAAREDEARDPEDRAPGARKV